MSINRKLKQFRQRITILTLVVFGIMFNLALALRPYFSAWYDYFFSRQINAPCNCSQLVTLPTHSLTLDALLGLLGVFIVLFIVALVRFGLTLIRTKRYQNKLDTIVLRTTVIKGVRINRVAHPQALAACLGYFQPQIYISQTTEQLLQPPELYAVLKHELHHARQRDPLQRLIIMTLANLFPFVATPFIGYQALQELAADEAVQNDQALRLALVKLLQKKPSGLPSAVVGFSTTDARIDRLLGQNVKLPNVWPVVIISAIFIFFVLLTYQDFSVEAQTTAFTQCVAAQPMCQQLMMSYVVP